jgi:hypothetical protein
MRPPHVHQTYNSTAKLPASGLLLNACVSVSLRLSTRPLQAQVCCHTPDSILCDLQILSAYVQQQVGAADAQFHIRSLLFWGPGSRSWRRPQAASAS